MIRWFVRRNQRQGDEGAYAILYALLMLVIVGIAAMVIDIAQLREDRRADRVLTDNAALLGADQLSTISQINPYAACTNVWSYLATEWGLASAPAGACTAYATSYNPLAADAPCPSAIVTYPTVTAAGHTVQMAWPVPDPPNDGGFLSNPDVNPANITQNLDQTVDGNITKDPYVPCERFAVKIDKGQSFNFATIFGIGGANVHDASVAINRNVAGPKQQIAALNVLNTSACDTLVKDGQGTVLVGKTTGTDPDTGQPITGPGIIAVESTGKGACGASAPFVIDPSTSTNGWLCADGTSGPASRSATTSLGLIVTCNGGGIIESHALDPTGNSARAYTGYPTFLIPQPTAEGKTHGWTPVTDIYGCSTKAPTLCSSSSYVGSLYSKYGGSTKPTSVYTAVDNSPASLGTAFQTLGPGNTALPNGFTFKCKAGDFYVPPGNWYVDCPDPNSSTPGFQAGTDVFGGGTIVFNGSVQAKNNTLVFNVPLTGATPATLPALVLGIQITGSLGSATVTPAPAGDAVVFIRGGSSAGALTASGSYGFIAPQTFFTLQDSTDGFMTFGANSSQLIMTAPKAASCNGDTDCQSAGFKKLVLWTECSCNGSTAQQLGGQGAVYLLGVFFTPRSEFDFTGQGAYASGAAQIWADTLDMKGQGSVILQPDPNNAVSTPISQSSLIR